MIRAEKGEKSETGHPDIHGGVAGTRALIGFAGELKGFASPVTVFVLMTIKPVETPFDRSLRSPVASTA